MSRVSNVMMENYIEIATRPLRKALCDYRAALSNSDEEKIVLEYLDGFGLRDEYLNLKKRHAALRRAVIKFDTKFNGEKLDYRYNEPTFSVTSRKVINAASDSDPIINTINDSIQKIKDTIRLAPAPESIKDFVNSLDFSDLSKQIEERIKKLEATQIKKRR